MRRTIHLLLLCVTAVGAFAFSPTNKVGHQRCALKASSAQTVPATHHDGVKCNDVQWIIQWRGEGAEGYSSTLRQWEFNCAFKAEVAEYWNDSTIHDMPMNGYLDGIQFDFRDALTYQGPIYHPDTVQNQEEEIIGEPIPASQVAAYESGMQYLTVNFPSSSDDVYTADVLNQILQYTIQRCSLVRNGFLLVASGNSYEELAVKAMDYGSFNDVMEGGSNQDATWSIRLRRYGPEDESVNQDGKKRVTKQARYGKNVRSPLTDERNAIFAMKDMVELFHGRVNLSKPDCKIYLFDGLKSAIVDDSTKCLARAIGKGPKVSIYAPKTRICVTTTPLCPIAAFTLCNVAQLRPHFTVLDPFAGSCASLLAAAHIATNSARPTKSQGGTVSIEVAHNGLINRDDILRDFESRALVPPLDIIHGDCMLYETRERARQVIGQNSFDCIITDPPYGIREAMTSGEDDDSSLPPLTQLFYAMGRDRAIGEPLLKVGGRLVAFIPVRKGETLEECLPELQAREDAGLVIEGEGREQVLNDILSRWLVSFVCVS
mmetsp:Transcript_13921/g.28378  ORF Transcript_13921/g.28378 Transcript_13921/m.28378 type:complete len:545 (+) Transcript_13921:110-1744(+)